MQDCKCLNQDFYLTQTAKVTSITIINPRHRRISLSSFNCRRVWQYRVNIVIFSTLSFSRLDLGLGILGVFDQNATQCWSFLWKSCSPNLAGHGCSIVRYQPVWLLLCDGLLCEIYGWLCELCGMVPHSMAWLSGVEHATRAHRDALALCQVLSKTGWNCPNDRFYRTVRNIVGEGWGVK